MHTSTNRQSFYFLVMLFFMWGFITVTNDILINTFKGIFDLSPPQRALVQFAFFGAFFIISLAYYTLSSASGRDPINRIGYKKGMAISLAICGLGCIAFYPAAFMHSYPLFLTALFILATGVTLLQICANPYATILGPKVSASGRLNQAQGFNSLGTTLGPLVGTILIYQVFNRGEVDVFSVADTYLLYGGIFLLLAGATLFNPMPEFKDDTSETSGYGALRYRHLVLGILAIFVYVGSEVSVGSWIVEFIQSDRIMGLPEEGASYFLSYFWGGLMIGRLMAGVALNPSLSKRRKALDMALFALGAFALIYLVTGIQYKDGQFAWRLLAFNKVYIFLIWMAVSYLAFIVTFDRPARALILFSSINALLLVVAIAGSGLLAFWALIGTGMFFSIGWSNIFSLAIRGLGKWTSQGSSLLVMAIVGGAVLPGIQSFLIQSHGVQLSFVIPLLGMIYLVFYGFSQLKSEQPW